MKNTMGIASVFLLLSFLVSSCSKSDVKKDAPLKAEEKTNISYGENSKNILDIYLPENRTAGTKTIILIHGGFWTGGDKDEFTAYAKFFQSQGFAVANINYRLTNTSENNIHPAQVNDIKKVIDFISSKASEWNISTNNIGLIGASSGGHLALLYTYAYNTDNKVKTVISVAGPANLTDARNITDSQRLVTAWFLGTTLEQNPSLYQEASPINHVNSSTKPTLLIHGKLDVVVPYQQALDLKAKLDQFNIKNNLITFDNLGHEDIINTQNSSAILGAAVSWLNENLN